jgi:hypothetical protein
MKEIETAPTTPEQLLKMLDAQMAARRAERTHSGRNRTMLLVGGVLFIVIAAGVALMVLSQMLSDLQHGERRPTAQTSQPARGNF